jgi:uncharacterized membrane protein HdeD (DUF308 family)
MARGPARCGVLLFGALAILRAPASVAALILLFGAYAVVNGVFTIRSRREPAW